MFLDSERKRLRMEGYDYSESGFYFVTICIQGVEEFFGKIQDDRMCLNKYGTIVEKYWNNLPKHYRNCMLDEHIIMPNHFHGIIQIIDDDDHGRDMFETCPDMGIQEYGNQYRHQYHSEDKFQTCPYTIKQHSLSEIIRGFKTFSSRRINDTNPFHHFQWQRSFHDEIIRDEIHLNNVRQKKAVICITASYLIPIKNY